MIWIIIAIVLSLSGLIVVLLGRKIIALYLCVSSIIFVYIFAFTNIISDTTNLDVRGKITWSDQTTLEQTETLVSVHRILQDNSYICYIKTPSEELKEKSYSDQDVKLINNPCVEGKIETRKITGTVKPDEWWNSLQSGKRDKEVYYIYAPKNQITES
ncbi:MAG TPA: hypothetical protein VHP31_08720 [Caproicibacter sp.]|nr:hypothetical protein [Caproicibacter sp.]